MLRDERGDAGRRPVPARNVLGEPLEICSFKPMTGFYRDGCCNTGQEDKGSHTICAVMTAEFLAFSKSRGNDLSTPVPAFGFPGLKPGDRWCLCAPRWQEAFKLRELPMPMSAYLAAVRAKVGHDLLTATAVSISVFNSDGRILLVRHADKGSWVIPGGAIDPNETPADAAVRECWEETGLFVEPMRIIGIFGGPEFLTRYPNGDVTYYTTIAFEARKISGSCKADGVETLDVRYFTKDECEHLTLTPESRLIAQRAFVSESAYFARATWSPGK